MRRNYQVYKDGEMSVIEYDAEEKRLSDRDQRDEERTTIATSIRHALVTLEQVDATTSTNGFNASVEESKQLLRDALHRIVGTRS